MKKEDRVGRTGRDGSNYETDLKLLQFEIGKKVRDFIKNYPSLECLELSVTMSRPDMWFSESDKGEGRVIEVFITADEFENEDY